MRRVVPALLTFTASAAVLVVEILAGRLMAPYVGVSLETFTGVIGTVLAGIAAGNAIGGALADRHDPHRMVGPALVAGGVLSWLSLPIIRVLGPGATGGPTGIVVLAAAAFLVPAAVLSTVGPMAAKLSLRDVGETGAVVGRLSAAATVGALAGTFFTGFVLVAAVPTRPIMLGVGAVLVGVGFVTWIAFGRRSPGLLEVALVGAAALASGSVGTPCQHETAYFCVNVEASSVRATGRSLRLDDLRHSYVDLADPTHLEFRYTRLFADVAAALPPGPVDALHIGGGGVTFPRYLAAVRPGSTSLVLEIDAELVRIATSELGLVEGPDLEVRVGDARTALDDLESGRFDLIVGDAFSGRSVPWHLTTIEVAERLAELLAPGGVYVMNVIDGGANRFARAELATLSEAFAHVAVIVPERGVPNLAVNQVLVASGTPLPPFMIDGDGELRAGDRLVEMIDGARPLRDDFAPADQLVAHSLTTLVPMGVKLRVDPEVCVSAGYCAASAPAFFVLDADELVTVVDGAPRPDDDRLRRIARDCPSGAIEVED